MVVVSESYLPGWKAFVDGVSTSIFPVNVFLRGVYLAPGSHEIEFVYVPWSFTLGASISILAVVGLGLIMTYRSFIARRSRSDENEIWLI